MAILGSILLLISFFTTKERIKPVIEKTKFKEQVKLLFKNDQWRILCIVLIFLMCSIAIKGSVGAYYAKYYLNGGDKLIAPFLATGVGASILAMIASTWITKFYCKVKLFRNSQILAFILCVAMYFIVGQDDVILAFVFTFLIWFVAELYMPIFWSSIAEAVDYGHRKTGIRVSGLAFGGIAFCQKFGMGIAGGLLGYLLSYFKYQADSVQSEFTLNGIALLITIIPAVFHLGIGLLMYKYFITNKYYNEIVSDLKLVDSK